jgi:alanine dehydrogenase
MNIGILGPPDGIAESRVLITPRQAGVLDQAGVRVRVERGAGERAGFADADYGAEGADVVSKRGDIIGESEIVLAVARPTAAEAALLVKHAILMGLYHNDAHGLGIVEAATARRATVVGLERAQLDGRYPFRERMAEVAGVVCAQLAAYLLQSRPGGAMASIPGRGMLLGGVTGVPPVAVVVIGAGALGKAATRAFAGAGASVLILDRDLAALESVEREGLHRVQTMLAGPSEVADAASWADVLVGAVRVDGGPPPKLLSAFQGKPGAIWIDLSIDEGGCIEESRPVYTADEAYPVEGVTLCPVPNLASWAGRTASRIGSALLAPVLLRAAEKGKLDLTTEPWLQAGILR